MSRTARGMTLIEVMVASAIAAVVVIGLGTMSGHQARVGEEFRRRAGLKELEQTNAALAAVHLSRSLEAADRVNFVSATGVYQIRIPTCPTTPPLPSCYDSAANYRWVQYRVTGGELRFYSTPPGCATVVVLAKEITALSLTDGITTNVVTYSLTWDNGPKDQLFRGEVTTRLRPYPVVSTGLQVPGGVDISPPPAACP